MCIPRLPLELPFGFFRQTPSEIPVEEARYTWETSILVYSNERKLVNFLDSFADEIDCMTVLGNLDHPDLVAIPKFISIVDLDYLGEDQWNFYLTCQEEGTDETPILLVNGWHHETPKSHIRKIRSNDYSLITSLIIDQKSKITVLREQYSKDNC
jgi:hypothetical protein